METLDIMKGSWCGPSQNLLYLGYVRLNTFSGYYKPKEGHQSSEKLTLFQMCEYTFLSQHFKPHGGDHIVAHVRL